MSVVLVLSLAVGGMAALVSSRRGAAAPATDSSTQGAAVPARALDVSSAGPVKGEPFEIRGRRLQAASLADLPGLYDEFRRLPWPEREQALKWLCTRWVELDAENGWAFLVNRGRSGPLPGFLTAWALRDPGCDRGALGSGSRRRRRGTKNTARADWSRGRPVWVQAR